MLPNGSKNEAKILPKSRHTSVTKKNRKNTFSGTPQTLKIVLSLKAAAQFSYFHPISPEPQKSTKNYLKSSLRATKTSVRIQAYFGNPLTTK